MTGALGCVSMLACMFFGALTGSGMATTSAIGGMMIPEMKRKGYDSSYAATLVCFGGIVGPSFRPPCPLCSTELQPKPPCLISSRPVSSPAL